MNLFGGSVEEPRAGFTSGQNSKASSVSGVKKEPNGHLNWGFHSASVQCSVMSLRRFRQWIMIILTLRCFWETRLQFMLSLSSSLWWTWNSVELSEQKMCQKISSSLIKHRQYEHPNVRFPCPFPYHVGAEQPRFNVISRMMVIFSIWENFLTLTKLLKQYPASAEKRFSAWISDTWTLDPNVSKFFFADGAADHRWMSCRRGGEWESASGGFQLLRWQFNLTQWMKKNGPKASRTHTERKEWVETGPPDVWGDFSTLLPWTSVTVNGQFAYEPQRERERWSGNGKVKWETRSESRFVLWNSECHGVWLRFGCRLRFYPLKQANTEIL